MSTKGKQWASWISVGLLSAVFAAGGAWAILGEQVRTAKATNESQNECIAEQVATNQNQAVSIQSNTKDIEAERKAREAALEAERKAREAAVNGECKERQLQMSYIKEQLEEIKSGIRELKHGR